MRFPAVAGRFYPSGKDELIDSIRSCFEHPLGPGPLGGAGSARRIVSAMAPHAGYMCSGMTAAHTYGAIRADGLPEAYVVIGPDHYGMSHGNTVCSEPYLTPLGECNVHEGIVGRLSEVMEDSPLSHSREHSVEVQIPFIQCIDPDPRIVPIVMGDQSPGSAHELASALRHACRGHDVVVIASTDMSHYIPKRSATRLDRMVLDRISCMDVEGMYRVIRDSRVSMCGYGPTAVAMLFPDDAEARVLKYTDSFDSLGMDPDAVVGYASAVFLRSDGKME